VKGEFKSYVEMICSSCKRAYLRHRDNPYKKMCSVCWKESKGLPITDTDMTIRYLQQIAYDSFDKDNKIEKQSIKISKLEAKLSKFRKIISNRSLYPKRLGTELMLNKSISRKLLSLCHPDKHNNSEASQEVTRWILSKRLQ
tara:strand:+ start:224 stop:649 length:426 start_codon:yes stop_codon:yes gene_type:complete